MFKKAIMLILLVQFTITGCKKHDPIDDRLVFRYNEHANISSLDPIFSSTLRNIRPVNQIFNGLITLDDSLNVKGDIAKKWIISDDGLSYKFIIIII